MNTIKQFIVVALLVLISTTPSQGQEIIGENSIEEVLNALSERNYQDAFVIIEANPSNDIIQFFNGGDGLYFDLTVKTVALRHSPGIQQMAEIASTPPYLAGAVNEIYLMTDEQKEALQNLLRTYDLNNSSSYQTGLRPGTDQVIGYIKIIRGRFNISTEKYDQFITDVFEKVFELENYAISYIEN